MASISRSTKIAGGIVLVANTTARAADVETDILTLFNAHNNHNSGTSKWSVVSAEDATSVPLVANNSTGTQNIANFQDNGTNVLTVADGGTVTVAPGGTTKAVINSSGITLSNSATLAMGSAKITGLAAATTAGDALRYEQLSSYWGYRRPQLRYASATAVDVANNTATANQTTIIFPDGEVRSVTEDTSSTHKYRRFVITATAEFTTGTEDSGLYSGLSEATNTWYAIYAVKSAINSANFVLVGTTTIPTQGNAATLNSNLGTNGWVYLGMIRNGDNSAATGDILNFVQRGSDTTFANEATGGAYNHSGIRLASGSGATSQTYTYAAGTGTTEIPAHIRLGRFVAGVNGGANATRAIFTAQSSATLYYARILATGATTFQGVVTSDLVDLAQGGIASSDVNSTIDIYLSSYVDEVLSNAQTGGV